MPIETSRHAHLFVSGPPRGGTTLLELVLSAHPEITIAPETTRAIARLLSTETYASGPLAARQLTRAVQILEEDPKLNSWPGFCVKEFLATLPTEGLTLAALLDRLFVDFAERNGGGTRFLGNKKSLYVDGLGPATKRVFPDARFIFVMRDPRDVIRSLLRSHQQDDVWGAALCCYRMHRHAERMRRYYSEDTFVIRYEDLVRRPRETCEEMCRFLGLSYHEQMVRFHELNVGGARLIGLTRSIHPNTTTPFNPELIGQWKKEGTFTPRELRLIENALRRYMNRYGYERETISSALERATVEIWAELWFLGRELRRYIAVWKNGALRSMAHMFRSVLFMAS